MQYSFAFGAALMGTLIVAHPRLALGQGSATTAPADTAVHVTFGAFVDGYYAWDFDRPPTFDRSFAGGAPFTTQPARHNEFNINLAFADATLTGARVHGRLALQAGTSVQSNYSGEPARGEVSGATLSRVIQEAFAGVKIGEKLCVDGGIFFSHMGMEGWVSRDNPTYTRSLVAEYSPYYSSGIRAAWRATPRLTAQLHVVNGWQNISESNAGKGVGIRLDYAATPTATVSYYNFFTDEAGNRLRTFNGVGTKAVIGSVTLLGEVDAGTQRHSSADGGTASWYGFTAVARNQITPVVAIVGRIERFDDPSQVVLATGQRTVGTGSVANGPFRGSGGSIGIDIVPAPKALWRTELRGISNRTAIFPDGATGPPKKGDLLVVSSLGLTF